VENEGIALTVITPVFNDQAHIKETLSSVIQEGQGLSYEYLVIDDGSTDSTYQTLEHFGDEITLIRKQNGGQASAINLGIQLAKGKYCVIVNSDDPIPNKGLFAKSIEILEKEPDVVCTYPDWSIIDDTGAVVKSIQVADYSIDEMYGNFNCLVGPGGVFRTDLARLVSGWDVTFKYVPDYDFWLKIAQYGKFKRISQNLAFWRQHSNSISVKSKNINMAHERIRVIENHQSKLSDDLKLNQRALANAYFSAATLSYFDSSIPGRSWAAKSLKIYPKILFEKKIFLWCFLLSLPASRVALKIVEQIKLRKPMN
jgi:glycosyltransferase involved in cell wall biosynthesis